VNATLDLSYPLAASRWTVAYRSLWQHDSELPAWYPAIKVGCGDADARCACRAGLAWLQHPEYRVDKAPKPFLVPHWLTLRLQQEIEVYRLYMTMLYS
jgi:hypothetical protein